MSGGVVGVWMREVARWEMWRAGGVMMLEGYDACTMRA